MNLKVFCVHLLILCCSIPYLIAAERNCGIKDADDQFFTELVLNEQLETTRSKVILGKYATVNVVEVSYQSSYIDILLDNDSLILKTTSYFRHYIDKFRDTTLRVSVVLQCKEGEAYNITVIVPLVDENTIPPAFDKNSYTIDINLPWPAKLPINFDNEIIIRDRDLTATNAEVYVTTSHRFVRAEITKVNSTTGDNNLSSLANGNNSPPEHVFKVSLYLQSEFEGGQYMVLLTSSDDVFNEYSTVVLNMKKSDLLIQAERFCKLIKSPIT